MESKNYIKIKNSLKRVDDKLAFLEELKKEAYENRQEICDECSHDFVLIYNQTTERNDDPEWCILKHAKCLICEKNFRLNEHYIDFETEEYLQSKNIIDATLFLSDYTQRLMRGQDNVAFIEAKQVFDSILNANTGCLNDNDYTNEIRLKVFELDQYYINLEEQRRKDYKEEVTKKKK